MKKIIFIAAILLSYFQNLAYAQSAKITELDSVITRILEKHGVPGAGVALVAKDSIIWLGNLGQADIDQGIEVTDQTLFGIGSISKTFLAIAAMIAQKKRMLDINHPIKQLIPSLDFDNRWEDTHPVRLVHLLEHTSGFDEAHLSLFSQAHSKTPLNEVMEKSKQSLAARWKPGAYFAYNNLGAIVAAYGIEAATNQPYENFVRDNIIIPLKMNQVSYRVSDKNASFVAKGYTNGLVEEPYPNLPQWPVGGLLASIEDMTALVQLFLNEGEVDGQQIISPASIRSMETPETSLLAKVGVQYGYGKGLRTKIERDHLFYGHDGSYGGFLSEFGYSRKLGIGYVILINNRDERAALEAIKEELLSSVILKRAKVLHQANPPTSLAGCYQPITFTMDITAFAMRLADLQFIEHEDGRWYQKSIFGGQQKLLPVGGTQFKWENEPIATSAFVKSAAGDWLWLNNTAYRQIPTWWGYLQLLTIALSLFIMLIASLLIIGRSIIKLAMRKKKQSSPQLLLLVAFGSFIGMIVSIVTLYDPFVQFSLGAILFLICGWIFFFGSFGAFSQTLIGIYLNRSATSWSKYFTLITSLAYCTIATYLLYWNIIGLTFWNY